MEGLTLSEQRSSLRWPQRTPRRYRSPRLPTPEASRSSNEAFEAPGNAEVLRRGPPVHELLLRASPERIIPSMQDNNRIGLGHRQGGPQSAPQSPPYRATDHQRPSLPPLKTLLGDNLSSPPQTPTTIGGSFQPFPCEPAYTTATYKPPSLYPNKKQRTGPFHEGVPPISTANSFSSPGLPASSFEPRSSGPMRSHDSTYPPMTMRPDTSSSRRNSAQYPSSAAYTLRGSNVSAMGGSTGTVGAHGSYKTPVQTPTSTTLDRAYQPSYAPFAVVPDQTQAAPLEKRTTYDRQPDPPSSRRLSNDAAYADYPGNAAHPHHTRHSSHQPSARVQMSPRQDFGPSLEERRRLEYAHNQLPPSFGHPGPYEPTQPSFFMPSHYEYQHGKARKRSNLPKQSTEIMKVWFDQNITNPYPSEEQKALFSNATGISMTQVSNWFINHRRRCPELRDKREKSRSNGRDCDI